MSETYLMDACQSVFDFHLIGNQATVSDRALEDLCNCPVGASELFARTNCDFVEITVEKGWFIPTGFVVKSNNYYKA